METVCEETKHVKPRKYRGLRIIIVLFILSAVAVFLFYMLQPKMYTAIAYLQILQDKPYLHFNEKQFRDFDMFVNTQFAIIQSPLILEKTLENPDVANIPIVRNQKDKAAWLAQKLELRRRHHSEIITVSITLPVPEDAEKIVNGFVSAFFEYYTTQLQDWNLKLLTQLNLELNRQKTIARQLQSEIQANKEREPSAKQNDKSGVTGFIQNESILREFYLNESKLEVLRFELKTLQETLNNPHEIDISATTLQKAIENEPMLRMLQTKLAELQEQVASLKKTLVRDDEPKIIAWQNQIKEIEKKIEEELSSTGDNKIKDIRNSFVAVLEQTIWEKSMAIRSQEILVENLKKRCNEQTTDIDPKANQLAIDTQFLQNQLQRINSIIERLELRIAELEVERYAPAQIQLKKKATIPTKPNRW
ncbi:MAG: hypothetical protein LBP87_14565 [Planctomycetaceae bacterium]|nr:hypothetical protein [Planctomycetaceae bacterium]